MLEIKNLFCGYDLRIILQGINLSVENGEFLGIIGPNGSGKTTLLRAITRVLKPKTGVIFFEGSDIGQMGFRELAKKVAVVPQESLTNFMSVEDFVLLGRIPHYRKFQFLETNRDKGITQKALEVTGTLELKDRPMHEISGGERQLVLIARSLTQEPKLLLLDEPTTHLDITHQVGILDLIRRLNKEFGLTVIMVLHDLNLASEYCRNLALISKGRIHKIGRPQEVLSYQIIEEVYKTTVVVRENPVSSKPYCFLVSQEEKERRRVQ
ncbi:MAG: ABC transporter ATP-binding protein [Candidatus Omnitrophica bacterium]|nr:ABC transporter ATP-binding protein [Candidatus Omnitrophota bacterium]MBU1523487.1 ABC transporter ATP-binding protein [Candidatus Omnitrophota bacterium]MBU2436964.1 ABC transporter ATP-binding protein [Candidatus Omnitrophota bacterium]